MFQSKLRSPLSRTTLRPRLPKFPSSGWERPSDSAYAEMRCTGSLLRPDGAPADPAGRGLNSNGPAKLGRTAAPPPRTDSGLKPRRAPALNVKREPVRKLEIPENNQ